MMNNIEDNKLQSSLGKMVPNIFTLASLGFGMTSLKFALVQQWQFAILCILAAILLDGIDGRIARFMGATSSFGGYLDSLCDLANFGVCPAIVYYLWASVDSHVKPFSWALILLYAMCMAIRLARFNVLTFDEKADANKTVDYFVGVPAPVGAFLALIPIMLSLEFDLDVNRNFLIIYLALIGLLLPSRLPTISIKKLKVDNSSIWIIMVVFGSLFSFIIIEPWIVLPFIGIAYLLFIPFFAYKIHKLNHQKDSNNQ